MKRICLSEKQGISKRALITSNKSQFGDKIMGEGAFRQFREDNPDTYYIGLQYLPKSRVGSMPIQMMLPELDEVWELDGTEDIIQLLIEEEIDIVFNIFKSVIKGKPDRERWSGDEIFALNQYRNYKSRFTPTAEISSWADKKLARVIPKSIKQQGKLIIGMHARHLQRKVYINMSLSWFAQLMKRVQEEYDPFIIVFGSDDNRPLFEGMHMLDVLPLKLNIWEVAGILSKCDLYIGGDTGITCLAAAMDIPLVGVNWMETPLNWPGRMYAVTPNRYICLAPGEAYKPKEKDYRDLGVELPLTDTEKREMRRHNVIFRRCTPLDEAVKSIRTILEHKDGGADLHHSRHIVAPPEEDSAGSHKKRGIAHYKARQYKLALEEFELAARLDPKYAEAVYLQGVCYYQMREYQKARDKWQLTLELNPSHQFAKEWIVNVEHILIEQQEQTA